MMCYPYVVAEYVGYEIIDEIPFDTIEKANKFIKVNNKKIDNSFAAPECKHYFDIKPHIVYEYRGNEILDMYEFNSFTDAADFMIKHNSLIKKSDDGDDEIYQFTMEKFGVSK